MTAPRITAAICTYNRYDTLAAAIESLTRQSLPSGDFEILVIDNSPDHEQSADMAKDYRAIANLKWHIETTPGLSNARNVATQNAQAPLIAFMDDDAVAARDWLETLISVFAAFGPQAKVVGGRVDPIWGVPQPSWLPDSLLGNVSVVNWGGSDRFAAKGEWVAGTNIAFRVDALKAAGGFAVHLGRTRGGQALLSNDETDVIERMTAAGAKLVYSPRAAVEHLVPAERLTQAWFRRRVAWQAVSDYLLDSQATFDKAPNYWRGVTEFFARLPPKYRTPRGLYVDQTDPEMFRLQMSALYNFTVVLLSGFRGLNGSLGE
ncbi:MAG TPA: glycosyltransferase family 2 protein [Rhizomicrobium sp.]|nr:glycosyltransferase family 2 protein [Rhizomicrobium sp.]